MKLTKSLALGASVALGGVGGASAADLPVKAKAIEYVKVCSLYGPGFYYIPGTDTCIQLGGYLRAEAAIGSNVDWIAPDSGAAGARNRLSNYYTIRSREGLTVDTRTASEYGVVRTFFNAAFSWTTGSYGGNGAAPGSTVYAPLGGGGTVAPASAPQNANPGAVAGGSLGVYYAFIQFAGFTMGKAVSQFSTPWVNYPANNFDGLPGGGGSITGVSQFTYTAQFGNGVSAAISAQDQVAYTTTSIWNVSLAANAGLLAGTYGASDIGGTRSPDIVGMVRVDQAWGLFQASVAAHDNHAAYYGGGALAGTEPNGYPADKWGWAGQLALSIKNIPTGAGDSINIQGVYTNGASRYNFQDLMATSYAMYGGTSLPGAYQSLGIGGVSDAVFVNGSGMELTTTYGFRGGFNHNWNPYWNSSLYGAWAAVRYNGTAKSYICGAMVTSALLSSGLAGCNPDFNYAVVGVTTGWTPVKNLTFSADLAYIMLDQKYAAGSTVAQTANSASVAKPAALYELKDQSAFTLLLRAQRNW
ncbi:porin-like protein [Bradyrhizobium macuxiense]|uniref:Porin n=1 Tax=Bradyrhizobium macuxiense TaxID=1755647 RepID=A0A560KXD6_9BRAD|nr:porin [Bradyrhizobium macuxiense]TWB87817.1 porin-like protein [Bradyrhizobium macuxiense]